MKKSYLHFGILSLVLTFAISCGSNGSTDNSKDTHTPSAVDNGEDLPVDYEKLVTDYCNCCENTVAINKQMESLIDAQGSPEFEKLVPEADKAFKKAINCCREAKLNQTTDEIDQKKMIKMLKGKCPDLPTQLVLKLVLEIK